MFSQEDQKGDLSGRADVLRGKRKFFIILTLNYKQEKRQVSFQLLIERRVIRSNCVGGRVQRGTAFPSL